MIPFLFGLGILMGSVGGVLTKLGAPALYTDIHTAGDIVKFMFSMVTNIKVLAGMFLYFGASVVWAYLLTRLSLSYVQPILALTYVVTPILAIILLNENVPAMRWLGIVVIILGVFIVSKTS